MKNAIRGNRMTCLTEQDHVKLRENEWEKTGQERLFLKMCRWSRLTHTLNRFDSYIRVEVAVIIKPYKVMFIIIR